MRRFWTALAAPLLGLTSTAALAHAHLQKALPANGSIVKTAPTSIVLTFSEPAKLTACWLQKGDEPKQKIVAPPRGPAPQISVPVPHLDPATYILSWRVVGDDGHVVPGQIQFTVVGN